MSKKGILVIDVDETLLNIEPLFFLRKFQRDYQKYEGKAITLFDREHYIVPRPRVKEFLELASLHFNLVAFSVVRRETTLQKLAAVGLEHFFMKVYGQEDLINNKKSLKMVSEEFGVPIQSLTAIDDIPEAFDETNSIIPVRPFYIGHEEYEYQEHEDNLSGALGQALRERQAIKVIPTVL